MIRDLAVPLPAVVALFIGPIGNTAPRALQETPAGEGDIAAGEAVYLRYGCYGCHGYSGQNGPGARLVGSPLTSDPAADAFIEYVRNPRRMPAYSTDVISDGQLSDMYAFIRTLEVSPDAEDIPLLRELIEEQ